MIRPAAALALALALGRAGAARSAALEARGALYYDRGHYWIEIAFHDGTGRDTIPPDLSAGRFEIWKVGDDRGFRPTRIEIVPGNGTGASVVLSTSRIEGRCCYRVTFTPASGGAVAADSICDPFAPGTAAGESGSRAFFRAHVAGAFRRDGEGSGLNELAYGYDFSRERSVTDFCVAPRLRWKGWTAEVIVKRGETSLSTSASRGTSAVRTGASASLSRSAWANGLRCSASASYGADRTALELAAGDSTVRSRCAAVEGRVRLDNLFDPINRYPASVLAGVEAAFGYSWRSADGDGPSGGGRFGDLVPYASAGASWTFLYGFRLSYSLWSFLPSSAGESFAAFHSVRARLLLGGVLAPPAERTYHPDVELVWETGKRLPLLEREEKLSLGFTFGIYPW